MQADSVYFKGHLCFQTDWAGFDAVRPINVIIGRNNSGKSHLLDLVEALSQGKLDGRGWQYRYRGALDEESLRGGFPERTSGGELNGNHWRDHGCHFVDAEIMWEIDGDGNVLDVDFSSDSIPESRFGERSTNARRTVIKQIASKPTHQLNGKVFRRLLADRDIQAEKEIPDLRLEANGVGASNVIRRFILSANPLYPSEVVQRDLLSALSSTLYKVGQVNACNRPIASSGADRAEEFPACRRRMPMLKNTRPPTDVAAPLPKRR